MCYIIKLQLSDDKGRAPPVDFFRIRSQPFAILFLRMKHVF
jgi:hypothetical protein